MEMQIKITLIFLSSIRMVKVKKQRRTNPGDKVEEGKPSCTVDGFASWSRSCGNQCEDISNMEK